MSWEDTIATLLVGTERRPGRVEADLLEETAIEVTRRRAGAIVPRGSATITHAPPESLPECSAKASQLLELVLTDHFGKGSRTGLTTVWVEKCSAGGRIVPARHVATLLELGTADKELRPHVRAVVGERGRWMAGLSTRWTWVGSPDSGDSDAPLDVIAERLIAARLRDPASGRDDVVAAAEGLAAADRAVLYGTLATGLGPEDETLLEALLDERSARVKETATMLLSRLPESAWARRMIGRVEPLVDKRRLSNRFTVELPDELDAAAARDGIVEKAPKGVGQRAWWLQQIVANVPLRWWEDALGISAAILARRVPLPEVEAGWKQAVIRQADMRWATGLFDAKPDLELLGLLDPSELEHRLISACRGSRPFTVVPPFHELTRMLELAPAPWSIELSTAVADLLNSGAGRAIGGAGDLAAVVERSAPVVIDRLTAAVSRLPDYAQRPMRGAINRITFRKTLDEEFT